MIELTRLILNIGTCRYRSLLLTCVLTAMMILPVFAADANIEAELGDTLTLHGISYKGSSVYLFMTGPDLPVNGVSLTDVSQRADKGNFNRIDLDSNQEWTFRWNTARIENAIKAGTYLVYVTNEPVDKAHLGGSDSYKTLQVDFKKSTTSKVSISSGSTYTLKPEMHESVEAPTLVITSPTPTPTPVTTPPTPAPTTLLPTTKASLPPALVFLGVLLGGGATVLKRE